MRSLFIILLTANVLMFGLAQGWFGTRGSEPGRQPGMMSAQLNPDALTVKPAQALNR